MSKERLKLTSWFFKKIADFGFEQYEISNFGSYRSSHNMGYWQYKDYIGLGSGAVGKLEMQRFYPNTDIEEYIKNPLDIRVELLSLDDKRMERIFLGLRSCVGVGKNILSLNELRGAELLVQEKKLMLRDGTFYNKEYLLADEIALFIS
jgi:oxygen-independent coproporphyrinogen-3 oxidase